MRFFVDISKSQKKNDKVKIAGDTINAIYSLSCEPGKSLAKNNETISCRSSYNGLSLITTTDNMYYISALTVEEVNQRLIKAQADAMNVFNKRTEKNYKEKEK